MTSKKETPSNNFQETKYYKPSSTGSGRVTIPISLARGLGWRNKDTLIAKIESKNGNIGIFLYKPKKT